MTLAKVFDHAVQYAIGAREKPRPTRKKKRMSDDFVEKKVHIENTEDSFGLLDEIIPKRTIPKSLIKATQSWSVANLSRTLEDGKLLSSFVIINKIVVEIACHRGQDRLCQLQTEIEIAQLQLTELE